MRKLSGPVFLLSVWSFSIGAAAPRPENVLVGTWILDSFVDTVEGREPVYAYGRHPVGQFIFGADGRFSFNIMRDPPTEDSKNTNPDPGDDNTPTWYLSYFGTYKYDAKGSRWIAKVVGGNIRSYIGTDQAREFKVERNVMTISGNYMVGNRTASFVRVLHRL